MSKLRKLAKEEIIYIATAPIKFYVISSDDSEEDNSTGMDSLTELKAAVDNSMKELGPSGLAQYIHNDLEEGLILSIIVGVDTDDKKAISKTVIKTSRELTSEELKKLKDYLTGQFSDGWGEGFEQIPICEWKEDIETEEYDEETKEYYTDTYKETMELCAHFWYSGLNIKIEKV